MIDKAEPPSRFRFSEPRHERIYARLERLVGPGSAAFFLDACHIVADSEAFASTTHLVGHLLRETESSIRAAFQPLIRAAGTPVPKDRDEWHRFQIEQALLALGIPLDDPVAKAWLGITGKGNEKGLAALAHRRDLGAPRPFEAGARNVFEGIVTVLDAILEKVEQCWEVFLARFDALAAKEHPTAQDAAELRLHLPSSLQARAHFFNQLKSPAWLEPLDQEGFFRQPPDPTRDAEAGTIGFPPWPESQYLIRVAGYGLREFQEQVVRIAEVIPDSDNVRVYEDLASIALAVPPDLARGLVPRISGKLPLPYSFLLPRHATDLLVQLAAGEFSGEAMTLARALFTIDPDPRADRYEDPPGGQLGPRPEPRPRMHPARYGDALGKAIPALAACAPHETILLLSDLLEHALRLLQRKSQQAGPEADSQVWWPDLAQPRPGVADDPPWLLLETLQHRLLEVAARNRASLLPLVEELERRPWHLFRRVGLFVLRVVPGMPADAIEVRLLRLGDHENLELHGEYVALLRERYRDLPPQAQQTIREYVARERDRDSAIESFRFLTGHEPNTEELARYQDEWRAERLRAIAEHLPPELRELYERWAKTLPRDEGVAHLTAGWHSPQSPKSTEELLGLSDDGLIQYLREVHLGDERFGPSREGLGQALAEAVARESARLARMAPSFRELEPAYQHSLFSGLHGALTKRQEFSWDPALDLAARVVAVPPAAAARRGGGHSPDEAWVRRAVVDLLTRGMQPGPGEIPIELRPRVWQVLWALTDDPDPTPADDATRTDDEGREGLYFNSIRGRALDAVWAYTVWAYHHIHQGRAEPMTVDPIPEVREVLERHLAPEHDPSPAMRVFYGLRLQQLRRLDSDWLRGQLGQLFSADGPAALLGRATWRSYLRFTEVHPADLEFLRTVYEHAVGQLGPGLTGDDRSAAEHLGRHLMRLQWLGAVSVHDRGGLVERYFEQADAALRGEALSFVGRALHGTKDTVRREVLEFVRELWQWRRGLAQGAPDIRPFAEEMAAFGWWFLCSQFESGWALRELHAALGLTQSLEMTPSVVERLAELSGQFPREAIDCLALIVAGRHPVAGPEFWLHEARPILEHARRSPDHNTQQVTIALINRLSSMGFTQFRDVL